MKAYEKTLHFLGDKKVGLFRADSGFYSKKIFNLLENKKINYIMSARMLKAIRLEIGASLNWIQVPAQKE